MKPRLAFDSLAGNRTRLSSTGTELIEMECQQMKSNENEITTHLNGSFAVPFTMTIKTIVISNQDCFDGEWNALIKYHQKRLTQKYRMDTPIRLMSQYSPWHMSFTSCQIQKLVPAKDHGENYMKIRPPLVCHLFYYSWFCIRLFHKIPPPPPLWTTLN